MSSVLFLFLKICFQGFITTFLWTSSWNLQPGMPLQSYVHILSLQLWPWNIQHNAWEKPSGYLRKSYVLSIPQVNYLEKMHRERKERQKLQSQIRIRRTTWISNLVVQSWLLRRRKKFVILISRPTNSILLADNSTFWSNQWLFYSASEFIRYHAFSLDGNGLSGRSWASKSEEVL